MTTAREPAGERPTPTIVARDLRRLVESEELGAALFGAAADLTTNDDGREAWHALRDLETQTTAGVRSFLNRAAPDVQPQNRLARAAGSSGAVGLRPLPYSLQLRLVRHGTKRYLPAFRRLAAWYSGTGEAAFFDYVVEHELAIIRFTESAIGAQRGAIDPVLRLLNRGVPGTS